MYKHIPSGLALAVSDFVSRVLLLRNQRVATLVGRFHKLAENLVSIFTHVYVYMYMFITVCVYYAGAYTGTYMFI